MYISFSVSVKTCTVIIAQQKEKKFQLLIDKK